MGEREQGFDPSRPQIESRRGTCPASPASDATGPSLLLASQRIWICRWISERSPPPPPAIVECLKCLHMARGPHRQTKLTIYVVPWESNERVPLLRGGPNRSAEQGWGQGHRHQGQDNNAGPTPAIVASSLSKVTIRRGTFAIHPACCRCATRARDSRAAASTTHHSPPRS